MLAYDVIVVVLAALVCGLLVCCSILVAGIRKRDTSMRHMACDLNEFGGYEDDAVTVTCRVASVVELARAINTACETGAHERFELNRAQKEFYESLSLLAHDIRTPLAGAKAYLELYGEDPDLNHREQYLEHVNDRLEAMNVLVDGLFDYAKALAPGSVNNHDAVTKVVTVIIEAFVGQLPQFISRGWTPSFEFDDEQMHIVCAPGAFERVCANLVSNILRYSVTAPMVVQHGSIVEFRNPVSDPSSIDVGRIFDRFYRGDASRSTPGTGLGLAAVERLCEQMGATVSARLEGGELVISIDLAGALDG